MKIKKIIASLLVTVLVSSSLLVCPKTMSVDNDYNIGIYNDRDHTSEPNSN